MDSPESDALSQGESWQRTRKRLIEAVRGNLRDWFQLDDNSELEDCLTRERVTAKALLAEFSTRLHAFAAPPFMLQRLDELAHLKNNVEAQYKPQEGFKYLTAVLKVTRVHSSVAVFDDFDAELSSGRAEMHRGIKLESISWLDGVDIEDAMGNSHMSLEAPEYF